MTVGVILSDPLLIYNTEINIDFFYLRIVYIQLQVLCESNLGIYEAKINLFSKYKKRAAIQSTYIVKVNGLKGQSFSWSYVKSPFNLNLGMRTKGSPGHWGSTVTEICTRRANRNHIDNWTVEYNLIYSVDKYS